MNTSQENPHNLAPPGAGIPLPHRLALRFFVKPLVLNRASWEESDAIFRKTTAKILKELEGLSTAQLDKRVLVPPQRGLEDSSRFWSVAMTLDHVVIVGTQMAALIAELDAGRIPDGKADTAAVKPSGRLTAAECVVSFQKFAGEIQPALLKSLSRRDTGVQFLHPWFGLMGAKSWFWLLGGHQGLHLTQIREIKKGL